jgi:hypothetical protein
MSFGYNIHQQKALKKTFVQTCTGGINGHHHVRADDRPPLHPLPDILPMLLGIVHQEPEQGLHKGLCHQVHRPRTRQHLCDQAPGLHVEDDLQGGEGREAVEEEGVEGGALLEGGVEDVVEAGGLQAVARGFLQLEAFEAEAEIAVALLQHLGRENRCQL